MTNGFAANLYTIEIGTLGHRLPPSQTMITISGQAVVTRMDSGIVARGFSDARIPGRSVYTASTPLGSVSGHCSQVPRL